MSQGAIPLWRILLVVFLGCLLELVLLHRWKRPWRASYGRPSRGQPVITRPTRFVLYDAWYGQAGNQITSLVNAMVIARRANAVLVFPYAQFGPESVADSSNPDLSMRERVELIGDYFDHSLLTSAVRGISPSDFLASAAGNELKSRSLITVPRTAVGYFNFFLNADAGPNSNTVYVASPPGRTPGRLRCQFDTAKDLIRKHPQNSSERLLFLAKTYHAPMVNCSSVDPQWLLLRRSLRPRKELRSAVDAALRDIERPLLTLHLRMFGPEEGKFTTASFVDMLLNRYSEQVKSSKSIFVAYTPSSRSSIAIVNELRLRFKGKVYGGDITGRILKKRHASVAELPYSGVIMDMWMGVKSDLFIGRMKSSMSWVILYWRQALAAEFELRNTDPVWYGISNFSTTPTSRAEWDLQNRP